MAIHYDASATSVVITCSECTYWYSFRFDRASAYASGEDHATRVHGIAPEDAANARQRFELRRRQKEKHATTRR